MARGGAADPILGEEPAPRFPADEGSGGNTKRAAEGDRTIAARQNWTWDLALTGLLGMSDAGRQEESQEAAAKCRREDELPCA